MSAPTGIPPLTATKPARTRRATASERSSDPDETMPASPYLLSLAMRTASSSSSKAMTTRTGPKRRVEVGVLQHDVGRLAAELEEGALHRRRAFLHDALAHHRRAREGDEVDIGRDRQPLPDQVVRRRHDVDDACWEVGALGDQPPDEGGVPGRVGCRLENDGVPRGQRLAQLVG